MTTQASLRWYRCYAPDSTTDRGWLYVDVPGYDSVCLGHYLDYGPVAPHYRHENGGRTVHAVSRVGGLSQWFATPHDAAVWLADMARGSELEFAAGEIQGRGAYPHEADAIRAMRLRRTQLQAVPRVDAE